MIGVFCHDMMNMVAKIICFMRMEVGHWYYTVVFLINIYNNFNGLTNILNFYNYNIIFILMY